MDKTALALLGVAKELVTREISRVGGDEVQEGGFRWVVAEALNRCDVFRLGVHSEKISCMISGSAIAGRSLAASLAEA